MCLGDGGGWMSVCVCRCTRKRLTCVYLHTHTQLLVNHPRTDLNLKSDGGITPLIAAVKVVNQFMVKQLLKKNVDIGATDKDGRTAVHWAAMVDNLDALKQLIRQGPDAIKDAQDSKVGSIVHSLCLC